MQQNQILILGSGTSTGIPMIACNCPVCTSLNPKDKRLRTSLLITTTNNKKILIDTTPDLRTQFLNNNIADIDGVIITHDHADHIHGIDDLRPICFGPPEKRIPVAASEQTSQELQSRFSYIFPKTNRTKPVIGGGIPLLDLVPIQIRDDQFKQVEIAGEEFTIFLLPHGHDKTMGIIHKQFAYIPDCHHVDALTVQKLKELKLDFLLIDCLQKTSHETHLSVPKAFEYVEHISPLKAGFIHMNHLLSHDELQALAVKNLAIPAGPVFDKQIFTYN